MYASLSHAFFYLNFTDICLHRRVRSPALPRLRRYSWATNTSCSLSSSLAYAGVGWALWRSKAFLPDEILFTVNYLGSPQVSFTLNFSKSAVQVIGQYYQLLRLGKSGYRAIMTNLTQISDFLAESVLKIGGGEKFVLMSKTGGEGLPLVAWRLKNEESYDGG